MLFVGLIVQYGEDADLEMSYRSKKARKKKQKGSIFDVCQLYANIYTHTHTRAYTYFRAHVCACTLALAHIRMQAHMNIYIHTCVDS